MVLPGIFFVCFVFFCRIPVVLENCRSSRGGGVHPLHPPPRSAPELAGGRRVETEGESQLFETTEKGGVMKNGLLKGGGSCKYVSLIM